MASNLTKSVPFDIRQQIASTTIKEALEKSGAKETRGNLISLKTGGSKLAISVRPKPMAQQKIQIENVENMMHQNHLSFNQTSRILTTFRKALGRNSIVPNAMPQIVERSHLEDDFFVIKKLNFQDNKGKPMPKYVPIVKDVETYLHHVYDTRNLDPFQSKVKIGIDFGGDSLKVGMSVIKWENEDEEYEEKKENLNSANRVLLLAIGNVTLVSISACSSLTNEKIFFIL